MSGEELRKALSPLEAGSGSSSGGGGGVSISAATSSALQGAPHLIRPVRRPSSAAAPPDTMSTHSRRRDSMRQLSPVSEFGPPRRRYSAISDDIFNPSGATLESHESSNWASVPLAFALMPAIGGLFFKNGSSLATDAILIGLAAVFLHWSVTQPWIWYHSAQEVRVGEESLAEMEMDLDDDESDEKDAKQANAKTNGAPPEAPVGKRQRAQRRAVGRLYLHEVAALASCFLFPVMAAGLLHKIRDQLTRPSEGLVSNYNLTIFLLAAEIRPLGQLMKLFQARTLHLQRVVASHPYRSARQRRQSPPSEAPSEDVLRRLERLESRTMENAGAAGEVRKAVQPELDALRRAVRQYEKRTAMLALQTDTRLGALDTRINDAVALAAEAAKGGAAQPSFIGWVVGWIVEAVMVPPNAILTLVAWPVRATSRFLGWRGSGTRKQGTHDNVPRRQGARERRLGRDRTSHA